MRSIKLPITLYRSTPADLEDRVRRNIRHDSSTHLLAIPMVILRTTEPSVLAVMTRAHYATWFDVLVSMGYEKEREFDAPTGSQNKLKRIQ